jgi:hypothetical protein
MPRITDADKRDGPDDALRKPFRRDSLCLRSLAAALVASLKGSEPEPFPSPEVEPGERPN